MLKSTVIVRECPGTGTDHNRGSKHGYRACPYGTARLLVLVRHRRRRPSGGRLM
jgi:hypothetical protein